MSDDESAIRRLLADYCHLLDDGRFEYQGRPYKSLTAVARAITGTTYSGPVFFGLKPSHRERKKGGV